MVVLFSVNHPSLWYWKSCTMCQHNDYYNSRQDWYPTDISTDSLY